MESLGDGSLGGLARTGLEHQCRHAVGAVANAEDPGAGLAPDPHLRDVEAPFGQARPGHVGIGHLIGDAPETILGEILRRRRVRTSGGPRLGVSASLRQPAGDLDGDAPDPEEQQPRAPLLEFTVEGQAQPQTIAVQGPGRLGIRGLDDGVIHGGDAARLVGEWCGRRQDFGRRQVFDGEQQHPPGELEGERQPPPGAEGPGVDIAAQAPLDGLWRQAPLLQARSTGLGVSGRKGQAQGPLAAGAQPGPKLAAQGALALGSEQFHDGVLQPEQGVGGAHPGVLAPPGRAPPEQAGVAARGGLEIADCDEKMIEGLEAGARGSGRGGHQARSIARLSADIPLDFRGVPPPTQQPQEPHDSRFRAENCRPGAAVLAAPPSSTLRHCSRSGGLRLRTIRLAIAGVGNCASALLQGLEYYGTHDPTESAGVLHPELGGIRLEDIHPVAAFDVDARKVGRPLEEAVFAPPNCTKVFQEKLPSYDVEVSMGPVLDGVAAHMADAPDDQAFRVAAQPPVDLVEVLRESRAEVLICYLPVGSEQALKAYAEAALEAGVAFVNCIPVFIASDPEWARRFAERGLPIVGDDIKSQVGATIVHRTLTRLLGDRGVELARTYQLNTGGNTDFLNMLERDRLVSKRISKTESVQSQLDERLPDASIHIGPSDYVSWQDDNKVAFIRMEWAGFGDVPMNLELRLSVEDSPNSAGVAIDAIRCAKIALERGIAGPLEGASAFTMKHPPRQMRDTEARDALEVFISEA